jgi:hypothetical protein
MAVAERIFEEAKLQGILVLADDMFHQRCLHRVADAIANDFGAVSLVRKHRVTHQSFDAFVVEPEEPVFLSELANDVAGRKNEAWVQNVSSLTWWAW